MAKQARQDAKFEEQVLLVGNAANGDAEDASGKRIYKATPKGPGNNNKVVDEIIEEMEHSLSINSKSMGYVVDSRHSLNRDD